MFEVHIPTAWGIDGLENTQVLNSYDNEELAWLFVEQYYKDHGFHEILLVRAPEPIISSEGYPSLWLDKPDYITMYYK